MKNLLKLYSMNIIIYCIVTLLFNNCSVPVFQDETISPEERNCLLVNYKYPLSKLVDSLGVKQKDISIHIDKSDYKLSVKNNEKILKQFPIVLGGNPKDDKRMQGDQCTPEGTFHIISKYPHKSWRKFLWIDYPNAESRKKFNEAKANGEIPENAKIGGEVGIHGTPEDCGYLIDQKVNWTLGCISLKRNDVDEIYPYIKEKTDIVIQK